MNFLEAQSILESVHPEKELEITFAISGTSEPVLLFLKAAFALHGYRAEIETLPFNTLQQYILSSKASDDSKKKVFVLFPWDLAPELDWRSGISADVPSYEALQASASSLLESLKRYQDKSVFYCPATIPPVFLDVLEAQKFEHWLISRCLEFGVEPLDENLFSIENYLYSGCPFSGNTLGELAKTIADRVGKSSTQEPRKVLVTDFDGVLWSGVIGEDGLAGISFHSEGKGYNHFIYQQLLKKLCSEGTLIAGVTRNDETLALEPFADDEMTLKKDDFIKILASYNAKSAQIKLLSEELNLGLNSFVFIDDNPIEIEEVKHQLPEVSCIEFPSKTDQLPEFLNKIRSCFAKRLITEEDRSRTALYRQRLEGLAPSELKGSSLDEFLANLKMKLTLYDRSHSNQTRSIQLINKTNQFNLNGIRRTEEEIKRILADGGKLYSAALEDRTGSHGEVLVILLDRNNIVKSFVMSCRVFQRHAEYAFINALLDYVQMKAFHYKKTDRNIPFQTFIDESSFKPASDGMVAFDQEEFIKRHQSDNSLFQLKFDS